VTDPPRPVHRHVWNGGVLPAWLDGHHHDDYGRLIIHTPNGPTRPEAGWFGRHGCLVSSWVGYGRQVS